MRWLPGRRKVGSRLPSLRWSQKWSDGLRSSRSEGSLVGSARMYHEEVRGGWEGAACAILGHGAHCGDRNRRDCRRGRPRRLGLGRDALQRGLRWLLEVELGRQSNGGGGTKEEEGGAGRLGFWPGDA